MFSRLALLIAFCLTLVVHVPYCGAQQTKYLSDFDLKSADGSTSLTTAGKVVGEGDVKDGVNLNLEFDKAGYTVSNIRLLFGDGGSRTVRSGAGTPDKAKEQTFKAASDSLPMNYSGKVQIEFDLVEDGGSTKHQIKSFAKTITIDRIPPRMLSRIRSGGEVKLNFTEPVKNAGIKFSTNGSPLSATDPETIRISADQRSLFLTVGTSTETMSVTVDGVTDLAGNIIPTFTTSIGTGARQETGQAVDYPPITVPQPRAGHTDSSRQLPSGRVTTRVVRLFYYRNAHKVAQVINRNAAKLNLSGVTDKANAATSARHLAEEKRLDRLQAEQHASEIARRLRIKERRLEESKGEADGAKNALRSLRNVPSNAFLGPPNAFGQRAIIPAGSTATDTSQLKPVSEYKNDLEKIVTDYDSLEAETESLRQSEAEARRLANKERELELLYAKRQFVDEVKAAQEDPNTYAAGNPDSSDPVIQTSVSVIGEGIIQLRGPIAGVNAIRRLINQIDVPVGQVKVELQTVQVNGLKGAAMEKVIGEIEGHINVGRFLTRQTLILLRRSVSEVASEVALEAQSKEGSQWNRTQMGRDNRYLYSFFGIDFIDTLYRMDSEFLHTENQILSLHSQDTMSRNRALFLLGLAKHSVRQRILDRFRQHITTTLPDLEFQYREANEILPGGCVGKCKCGLLGGRPWLKGRCHCRVFCKQTVADCAKEYRFINFFHFFDQPGGHDALLNPLQREFIRLAQIFKSQMVAESELKQRIIERGIVNQQLSDSERHSEAEMERIRTNAVNERSELLDSELLASKQIAESMVAAQLASREAWEKIEYLVKEVNLAISQEKSIQKYSKKNINGSNKDPSEKIYSDLVADTATLRAKYKRLLYSIECLPVFLPKDNVTLARYLKLKSIADNTLKPAIERIESYSVQLSKNPNKPEPILIRILGASEKIKTIALITPALEEVLEAANRAYESINEKYSAVMAGSQNINETWREMTSQLAFVRPLIPTNAKKWKKAHDDLLTLISQSFANSIALKNTNKFLDRNRRPINRLRILDHLLDEKQEKAVDLLEGRRAHISVIDNYLKKLAIALEDDFQIHFYNPSLKCIRQVARKPGINLSIVERTSVLGNNRDLLKVQPQAMMEFNLPKREIRIQEAIRLARFHGRVLSSESFSIAAQLSGVVPASEVTALVPGLKSSESGALPQTFNTISEPKPQESFSSLVPDPNVFKLESGTGYQVHPVIQPDGDSLVYDLTYLYTTNLLQPTLSDDPKIGRVRQHFLHTQVQSSSYDLREVGRYQVAVRVENPGVSVPGLDKIPVIKYAYQAASSSETSIQQNIVLAKSVVYPTLYDLMGLQWGKTIRDLNYENIRQDEYMVNGRHKVIEGTMYQHSGEHLDKALQIQQESLFNRPDLYHSKNRISPFHPNGFVHPNVKESSDPLRRGYRRPEGRPQSFRHHEQFGNGPSYDERFRRPRPIVLPQIKHVPLHGNQ